MTGRRFCVAVRAALLAWILAAVVPACAPSAEIAADIPAEITRVGALRAGATEGSFPGVRRASTPLIFPATTDGDWTLYGYSDADLARFRLPNDGVLETQTIDVVPASQCWRLPPPTWSLGGSAIPPLAAEWTKQCPAEGRRHYDLRCGREAYLCGRDDVIEDGCIRRPSFEHCAEIALPVAIESDGRACALERPAQCAASARGDGGLRWECGNRCTYDFYGATPQIPLEVASALIGPPAAGPPGSFTFKELRLTHQLGGSLTALGVRDGAVIVASVDPPNPEDGLCPSDALTATTTQHLLDPETMARSGGTILHNRCVTRIVPDVHGDGFYAAFHTSDHRPGVARVSPTGVWGETRILDVSTPTGGVLSRQGIIEVLVGPDTVVLIELFAIAGGSGETAIHVLRASDLSPLDPPRPHLRSLPSGAAWLDGERFLLSRADVQVPDIVTVGGGVVSPPGEGALVSRLQAPTRMGGRRVLVPDNGLPQALALMSLSDSSAFRVSKYARPFERPGLVSSTIALDDDRALASIVLAGDTGVDWHAALAVVETTEDDVRLLPGMFEPEAPIYGAIMHLQKDGRGRVWAMAPWAGQVLRITIP